MNPVYFNAHYWSYCFNKKHVCLHNFSANSSSKPKLFSSFSCENILFYSEIRHNVEVNWVANAF